MQRAKFRNLCRDIWRFFMLRFSKHPPIKAKPKTCDDPKKKKSWNRSETDFHFSKREAPSLVLIVFNCHTFPFFPFACFFFWFLGMFPPQKAVFYLPHLWFRVSRRLHGRVWCTKSYGLRLVGQSGPDLDFRTLCVIVDLWIFAGFGYSTYFHLHRMLILILCSTCLVLDNAFLAKS